MLTFVNFRESIALDEQKKSEMWLTIFVSSYNTDKMNDEKGSKLYEWKKSNENNREKK